jgi:flagellar protein FlaG
MDPMSRIDANVATQIGDHVRPTNSVVDRQQQNQQAQIQQAQVAADGQKAVGAEHLYAAAAQLKQVVETASARRLSMDIDQDSEQAFMRVTDLNTGEVIKQIPSKEVMELHARLRDFIGMFIDKTA